MEICLAQFEDRSIILKLHEGNVYIDDEIQPIKHLTEAELEEFEQTLAQIPFSEDPGYAALINAKRTEFIVGLLGRAVGDDCVNLLTEILDRLHFSILEYLGEDHL